ncbi:putative RNase H-like HicB family nuclease [Algoriphagus aquaeductus]|uniref:Putative RNase H-like HicB family nuclease n=1 Tax=Algoriphagus aquaeductus TaxID=475299 RepID=A0A326RZC2_9BACT|nr:type II toxin-antitoxin system HicB family antitoxin [Algoriphagus aquaeductus]PZV86368.1 putative RNase H-like HicB family nuclease [Algoriphagus aquaeductus]
MKKYRMIIEKTDTGFSAYSMDFPVFTTGDSMNEVLDNSVEALNLYFEEINQIIKPEQIKLEIDFQQFFQYYNVINAKVLAEKIGMNPTLLSQYVSGKKRPSEAQSQKILSGINRIGKELSELKLTFN